MVKGSRTTGEMRYPLVENRIQAEILSRLHAEARPLSKGSLTEALDVSRTKVSSEISNLMELGLLAEEGLAESDGGRRSTLIGISGSAGLLLAVDLGATSIDVALTDLSSEVVAYRAESADIRGGPKAILGRVRELAAELLDEQGASSEDVLSIGIGVPGPVEQAAGVLRIPPIMPGWDRFPIRNAFSGEYAAPVFVDNDVNVMAIGENWGGVSRGVENVLFVKVGTGIGCGIIADGRIYRGTQGSAGDIGHIGLDPEGPVCTCGNRGCLEAMAAAPAIVLEAERRARAGRTTILAEVLERNGELTAEDVGDAAGVGDYEALSVVRESGRLTGRVIASLVSVMNPSLIVIGGGVSRMGHAFLAEIRSTVYQRSLPLATNNLPIVLSELGNRAGIVGASVMAARGAFTLQT